MRTRWDQAKNRQVRVDTHERFTQISSVEDPSHLESLKIMERSYVASPSTGQNMSTSMRNQSSTNILIKELPSVEDRSDDDQMSEQLDSYDAKKL